MRRTVWMPILLALLIAGLCLTNLSGCADPAAQENGGCHFISNE